MALGLLGRKLGMTQINDELGRRVAVTIIETGPCTVVQKKTPEKDGYSALKIGFGDRKEKRTPSALAGVFKKANVKPQAVLREYRILAEELAKYETGKQVKVEEVFKVGQYIDVTGKTKGKGFSGVMKRHRMKGNRATHGTHEFWRHGGSIGCRTWPGYVHKNKRMCGHDGNDRVTIPNLKVVQVLAEQNCLLVAGAVPGFNTNYLELKPSATRTN